MLLFLFVYSVATCVITACPVSVYAQIALSHVVLTCAGTVVGIGGMQGHILKTATLST